MTDKRLLDRRAFIGSLLATPVVLNLLSGCNGNGSVGIDGSGTGLVDSDEKRLPGSDPALAAAKINLFGADLLDALGADSPSDNVIISPLSVATTLAMAAAGASGLTDYEMGIVLGASAFISVESGNPVGDFLRDYHPSMNALLQSLADRNRSDDGDEFHQSRRVRLELANALWAQSGYSWKRAFLDTLAQQYGTGVHTADFATDPDGARTDVNRWVSDATDDRITELVPAGDLTELTRLVLINAVDLAADWQTRFTSTSTEPAEFTSATGDVVTVEMMHLSERLGAAQGDGWVGVELPYAFGELSMVIAIPDQAPAGAEDPDNGVPTIDEVVERLEVRDVNLGLPIFELDHTTSLAEVLSQLGMPKAFTTEADFSGMTDDEPLLISDVVHRAIISVDENGTRATAATAVEVMAGGLPPDKQDPIEIVVDRPFTFWLRDTVTGVVIFTGRVNNPIKG